jgi:hypothetical protein
VSLPAGSGDPAGEPVDRTAGADIPGGAVPGAMAGGDAMPGEAAADERARRARAERAARGMLSAALCLEAITVLFVPRAIAPVSEAGLTGGRLAVLLSLAGALLLAAGLQRSRIGLVLGSVLQVAVIATGVLVGAMYVLGLIFGAVWLYLLRVRRDLTAAGPARATP